MAGVRQPIVIEVDDADARALLAQLERFGDERMDEFFRDAGGYLQGSTRERAKREEAPDGSSWEPLSADYAEWKGRVKPGNHILKFDFHMLGDFLNYQVNPDELLLGTASEWGATHQEGDDGFDKIGRRRNIPARPFIGASKDDRDVLIAMLEEHLEEVLDGR